MADQYILLPRRGLTTSSVESLSVLANLPRASSVAPAIAAELAMAPGRAISVIDTVAENGAKLVELSAEVASEANRPGSSVRALPIVSYGLPFHQPHQLTVQPAPTAPLAPAAPVVVVCRDARTGAPLPDCNVVAFTSFAGRVGASGTTDAGGRVTLTLSGALIDRLYVYAPHSHWGAFRQSVPIVAGAVVTLDIEPVDLSFVDGVRHYYGASRFNAGAGVTVGVIDTGVDAHPDLNLLGGRNTVTGEAATAFGDWQGHGSHVAGLAGAMGAPPTGLRGVAPGVNLRAYRVFGVFSGGATNYAVLKALIAAAADNCDIVNLSLGGGPYDPIVEEAIADARNQGMLVVIAAGNDGRRAVNFPAAYVGATAVSALGREGAFPAGSLAEGDVERPPNGRVDPLEFIASFSNIGTQVCITAPGVGVLSTLPGGAHGPMSGTSMAAPVAAGAAASLLSQSPAIQGMPRDRARSDAIERLLQTSCTRRGFGAIFEGYGLPDPALV